MNISTDFDGSLQLQENRLRQKNFAHFGADGSDFLFVEDGFLMNILFEFLDDLIDIELLFVLFVWH